VKTVFYLLVVTPSLLFSDLPRANDVVNSDGAQNGSTAIQLKPSFSTSSSLRNPRQPTPTDTLHVIYVCDVRTQKRFLHDTLQSEPEDPETKDRQVPR